ncbi:hypothetical protein F5884DRAFT_151143 [Xylogone sp. PMI_703]|nr:hypothetical protein F5884DRAFT_151143 [Xylogone sp. PMI_703]
MPSHPRWDSGVVDPAPLGQTLKFIFSEQTAPNRFLKSATSERLSSWDPSDISNRGIPSERMVHLYRAWSQCGAGIIITGNIMIEEDQLEVPGNAIIPRRSPFSGERFERFQQLCAEARKGGSLVLGQVNHPGRQVPSRIQQNPVSASAIQSPGAFLGSEFAKPHPASKEEIANIIEGFAHSAEYLHKCGFDGIELQAAHGFLLSQFLSKKTNKREDEYGGAFLNRARLLAEILEAIRNCVPQSFVVGVKINSTDFQDDKLGPEELEQLNDMLESNRVDFVELSGGTYELPRFDYKNEAFEKREAFFIDFAELIRSYLRKTKVYITGGLRSAGAMVKALTSADGIGIGRPLCAEPHLCADILSGKVMGAILPKIDPRSFSITALAAGAQLKQIAQGEQPIDLSYQENAAYFLNALDCWIKAMEADAKGTLYELMDLDGALILGSKA